MVNPQREAAAANMAAPAPAEGDRAALQLVVTVVGGATTTTAKAGL
jgi:hypothetical protein